MYFSQVFITQIAFLFFCSSLEKQIEMILGGKKKGIKPQRIECFLENQA